MAVEKLSADLHHKYSSDILTYKKKNRDMWDEVNKKTNKMKYEWKEKLNDTKSLQDEDIYDSDDNDSIDDTLEQIIDNSTHIKLFNKRGTH